MLLSNVSNENRGLSQFFKTSFQVMTQKDSRSPFPFFVNKDLGWRGGRYFYRESAVAEWLGFLCMRYGEFLLKGEAKDL